MNDWWSSRSGEARTARDVHLDWSPGSGGQGLADAVRAAIRAGRLREGEPVPSTRALARDLGIARGTVTRVYADLAAEGYLHTSQGAPTRIATAGAAPFAPPDRTSAGSPARWNLLPGHPDLSAFPRSAWLAATRTVLRDAPSEALGYGDERGSTTLRGALAAHLGRTRGVLADPERIVVCGGFSHALRVLATVLLERGHGEIAFENPSLPIHRDIAAASGLAVRGAEVDEHGIRVSELDSPGVVVTPAHQYPLGGTLAPERRADLARWARETGATVIEDDYDGEFRFDRRPIGAVQALAPEHVVYAGTASKTLAPALRLGWLVLPRTLVDPVRAVLTASGWRAPVFDQLVLAELLTSGAYDRHVRRSRAVYRARRDRLLAALPPAVRATGISAGLHLVLSLPDGQDEDAVVAAARTRSLAVQDLGWHWVDGTGRDRPKGLVVGYATPPEHAFAPTVRALIDTLTAVLG